MERDPAYLEDILEAAKLAISFVDGMDRSEFLADRKTQAAVIREIEIIGEASNMLSVDFRVMHPEVPWREAISMRNRVIHGYQSIDLDLVWDTIQIDMPTLIEAIESLIQ